MNEGYRIKENTIRRMRETAVKNTGKPITPEMAKKIEQQAIKIVTEVMSEKK